MPPIGKKFNQFKQVCKYCQCDRSGLVINIGNRSYIGEKFGSNEKTETSEEYKKLKNETEERKEHYEKLSEALNVYMGTMCITK